MVVNVPRTQSEMNVWWPAGKLANVCIGFIAIADYRLFQSSASTSSGGGVSINGVLQVGTFLVAGYFIWIRSIVVRNMGGGASFRFGRLGAPILWLYGFAGFMFLTATYSGYSVVSALGAGQLLAIVAVVTVACSTDPDRFFDLFARRYVVFTAASALLGLVLRDRGYDRYSWANLGPVASGTFAAISLVVLAAWIACDRKPREAFRRPAALYAVIPLALFATVARTATVTALGAILIVMWLSKGGVHRFRRLALMSLFFGAIWLLFLPQVEHFVRRGQSAHDFSTFTGRTVIWNESLKAIHARPWLGYGFQSTRFIFYDKTGLRASHNVLFEVLTNGGLLGASLLFLTLATAVFALNRKRLRRTGEGSRFRYAVAVGVLSFLVLNGAASSGFASAAGNQFVWFAVIVGWAASRSDPKVEPREFSELGAQTSR
jgi:hypothetical protein